MKQSRTLLFVTACLLLSACQAGEQAEQPDVRLQHVAINAPFGSSHVPTVATDSNSGTSYTVFFRGTGTDMNLYAARKAAGSQEWDELVRVNSVDGDVSPHPQAPAQIVTGPNNSVHVVWTNSIPVEGRRFPASNLLIASSRDGGRTFEPQMAINSDAGGLPAGHTFHDVSVAPDGRILVTWLDSRNKERDAVDGKEASTDPAVTGSEIWLAVSEDGGRSFRESTIALNTCQCCRTSVVANEDGTIYMAWRHVFPDGSRDMVLSTSSDGGRTFSDPSRIHEDNWTVEGCPHSGPSLAIDDVGNVHVAWYTGATGREGLYYAVAGPDGEFGEPTPLVQGVPVSQVKLSGATGDAVWIAWEEQPSGLIRLGHGSATSGLTRIQDYSLEGHSPAISTSDESVLVVSQVGMEVQLLEGNLLESATASSSSTGAGG